VQAIIIAAQRSEGLDVFAADGLADARAGADFEQRKSVAAVVVASAALTFGVPAWPTGGFYILTFKH
jgi:hypothetical protein